MGDVSDEMLTLAMAVADGEASRDDERKLQAALAVNPALASQFAAFKATGRELGRVFDEVMAMPVPDQLVQAVLSAPAPRGRSQTTRLMGKAPSRWRDLFSSWEVPALTFAAAALAFTAGGLLMGRPAANLPESAQVASLGSIAPVAGLTEALAKVASGSEQQLQTKAGAISVRVVETFRDQSGAPCREFEAQSATGPRQFGVACRSAAGWQLKAVFEGPARNADATVTAGPGLYGEKLDDVVGLMRQGEALSADEEKKLIAGGW